MEALAKGFGTLANNFETGVHDFDNLSNDIETLVKDFGTITRGRWEWKSNSDSWSKTEPAQWEPYSLEHNYLIEKAYYDKKGEVDIGDYTVSIKHMIQKKKGYITKQRPIRRINWIDSVDEKDRSDRYLETESPKTINKIFGSLGDFISFFSRRNQEILDFANHFQELEQSNDLTTLNQRIVPKLVTCFKEVLLKPNLEQLKDSSLSPFKRKTLLKAQEKIEELICLFKREFSSFEEFYERILRAYTMDTDLYPILNNYLRNENWVEVDKLLPYIFCLCKAFFNLRQKKDSAQESETLESPNSFSTFLYRGTAFDEFTLSFYNREKMQYFSWNSVTSTSKNKKIAEEFMYKNTDLANKKYPVLFVIEIPLANEFEAEYLKWIDIHQYSAIPKEDEVVLAPGSAFELIEVSIDQDEKTIIKINLKNEIKSLAHGGMMMQGALQSQMMTEKEAKIMCLEGEELSQALMGLCGNKLKEEVEFCLCTFDKKSLRKLFEALPTLEKAKRLKFIACMYQDNGEIEIERPKEGERCGITKIEVIEANDFFQRVCNDKYDQKYWESLRELDLDFRSRRNLTDEELNCAVSQGLKHLPQLTYLSINIEGCWEITDKGRTRLVKGLNSHTQLVHLKINFKNSREMTDNILNALSQIFDSLTELTHLDFDFGSCGQITDDGVNSFARGLSSLPHLTHFNLSLNWHKTLKDKKANFLINVLSSLSQLTHLNLDFWCDEVSDEAMENLGKKLDSLTKLIHLNISFQQYEYTTDKGTYNLSKELTSGTQSAHFILDFGDYKQITNEGINSFAKGLNSLTQLTHLNLDFGSCKQITDEGVNSFAKGLNSLTKLTHLDFRLFQQITDEGVNSFAQGLSSLSQLTHLNLDFVYCEQITDEGINSFAKGLNSLTQLTHLDFRLFKQITDDGVNHFAKGLISLTQLTHLNLDFGSCKQITNEGVGSLMSQGLKNLTQLTSLIIDFDYCEQVTAQDLQFLACKWLENLILFTSLTVQKKRLQNIGAPPKFTSSGLSRVVLTRKVFHKEEETFCEEVSPLQMSLTGSESPEQSENILIGDFLKIIISIWRENEDIFDRTDLSQIRHLTSLTFDFEKYSDIITDEFLQNLSSQVLKNLPQLRSLTLIFYDCSLITDKGVSDLASHGLKSLNGLKFLKLDFFSCEQVTDKGVMSLAWEGLRHLFQLESLSINFSLCEKVTDEGFTYLAWNGLRHLSQLESLDLNLYDNVTDEGLDNLVFKGLKYLTRLKSLTFDFVLCAAITEKGVNNLILQIVKILPQLTELDLGLADCENVSDSTVRNITQVLHYFGFKRNNNWFLNISQDID